MADSYINEKYGDLRAIDHLALFTGNPDLLDFLAVQMYDLFVMSGLPEDQARANKCREVLQCIALLNFPEGSNKPTFESVKELCRRMVQ
ncbi:MAG: hypothetical protein KKF27_21010 [Gammaproteobacteria bacterium]|nr:hypothetical protein [Gammaproteobacteria bacterium]MBU2685731.1 hypothetical protein [Gammaproteobacteria bacterium]